MAKRRRFMADTVVLEQKIDNMTKTIEAMSATLMLTISQQQETIEFLKKKSYPMSKTTENSLYGLPYWNKTQEQAINLQQVKDN